MEGIALKKFILGFVLLVTCLVLVVAQSLADGTISQSLQTQPISITKQSLQVTTNDLNNNLKNVQMNMALSSSMPQPSWQWGYTYNAGTNAAFTGTNDSGFAIADNVGGICLTKLDNNGNATWSCTYSSSGVTYTIYSVQQTSDNGYVMAGLGQTGTTYSAFILKVNSSGQINWYTTIPSQNSYVDVKQTLSGGYALLCSVNNSVKLLVLDSTGNSLWSNIFSNYSLWENGIKVIVEKSTGYIDILTQGQNIPAGGSSYYALYKYKSTGELLAQTSFSGWSVINTVKNFVQTQDYGYALIGDYPGNLVMNYSQNGLVLMKLNNSFSNLWTKMYPFNNDQHNFIVSDSLEETPYGKFVLLGHLMLNVGSPSFNMDTALYGADNNGNLQWPISLNLAPREYPSYIHSTSDGSYYIGGCLVTANGYPYVYLVKLK
jgi:hypothetical protein